jgi:uncharacterized protein
MTTIPTIPNAPPRHFHIMTKPIGPICNLDCKYCFYLEKEKLYPADGEAGLEAFKMKPETLDNYIQQYIEQQDIPDINFAWQGGEPTLMGIDFFKRVVELQQKYCPPTKRISNAFQTNGTLLDDDWCAFFKQNSFLVGLSVDGPRHLHDLYRVNKGGKPTFDLVMRGRDFLKKHDVDFNTLTVVHRELAQHPLEVYNFLKEIGSGFMQFIPLVERLGAAPNPPGKGPALADPPLLKILTPYAQVTPWSVDPVDFGNFLCTIFDEWVRHDVGKFFIQLFDVQLGIEMGMPASLCVFAETCGKGLALEHNGDLYSCDHFVYPQYKLGNISTQSLGDMVNSEQQLQFGLDKQSTLPAYCQRCEVKQNCQGECPKHRFLLTPDGEPGLNYLCAGYKKFFNHMKPHMHTMRDLLRRRRAPAEIMQLLAQQEGRAPKSQQSARPQTTPRSGPPSRNDPCPCGSGKKFKKCCGA